MKVGIIGRTRALLDVGEKIISEGFEIPFVYTCRSEPYYNCDEKDFEIFSKNIKADFYADMKINSEERVRAIEKYDCDVAISLNWLNILKQPICNVFKYGIWNAHAGDLPKYRGNACPNWAIINNESRVGLSIHEIVPDELDSGDILCKEFFELSQETYIGEIYDWMNFMVPKLFINALNSLKREKIEKQKQSTEECGVLRCYPRKPEDSKILWNQYADSIHRLIRASSRPFSGAFCYLEDGTLIRVWRANLLKHYGRFCAVPGQVLYGIDGNPVVACADGVMQLTEVTFENNQDAKSRILSSLRNRLV